jgi:hypothetical protein
MTDVQDFARRARPSDRQRPGRAIDGVCMRLFNKRLSDNWWERVACMARFAPAIVALLSVVIVHSTGYYWE